VPWSELALALALVGAATAPAFLVAAAGIWRESAGDELSERLVDATEPDRATT